ncbi:MAG: SAM-dependent methyltransferase [Acidobacteriota bacterium]
MAGITGLFRRKKEDERRGPTVLTGPRIPRHSSGWQALLKHLQSQSGLRVLDIGPTSPQNINFLTEMGHSVYMADIVHESLRDEWKLPPEEDGTEPRFNVDGFFEQNLNFHGRQFDVVLLWATLDYIPTGLIEPLVTRLKDATLRDGKVLAIFHSKPTGPYTAYCRYHLTGTSEIEMQESEPYPVRRVYTNRQIEKLFTGWTASKFFLAKDNLYEVIVTR